MASKPRRLTKVETVIRRLGGIHAVAALTNRNVTAVHNWIALRRFSATTYLVMTTALHAKGFVASPGLWSMEGKLQRAA